MRRTRHVSHPLSPLETIPEAVSMYNADVHRRKSTRLVKHEYRSGTYFVTILTIKRLHLFGSVASDRMYLSAYGCIARDCWMALPAHFPFVTLEAFVIMPDHMHGVLRMHGDGLTDNRKGAACRALTCAGCTTGMPSGTLGSVINAYKSAVTKRINALRSEPGSAVWHRNYHDRIIRTDADLQQVRQYIEMNPSQWSKKTGTKQKDHLSGL